MRDIHVLHVLNSAHGGSALSTFELITELKKHNIKSSLVCLDNATQEQRKRISVIAEDRVLFLPLYWMNKRIRVRWWKRPILELLSIIKTWKGYRYQKIISDFIIAHNITIVHTSTILNREGAIAAERHKLPHVWHVRELIGPGKHFQFPRFYRWTRRVSAQADLLVANSRVTESCLMEFFSPDLIRYIPNGINVELFSTKQHAESVKFIVGMVGNVTSRLKNHKLFVRVAAACGEFKNIEFRIYGSLPTRVDSYFEELKDLIRHHDVSETCNFVDFVNDPSKIMSEIDVLFHPTSFESFGRIFIEAMASAIPVIGINKGGALEMVRDGENGYLVDEGEISTIVNRIVKLQSDPKLRQRLGLAGQKLVREEYTLEILAKRLVSLYNNL